MGEMVSPVSAKCNGASALNTTSAVAAVTRSSAKGPATKYDAIRCSIVAKTGDDDEDEVEGVAVVVVVAVDWARAPETESEGSAPRPSPPTMVEDCC